MPLTTASNTQMESGFTRGWPMVLLFITLLTLSGWAYLVAMVADMVPVMDMTEAGPGMGLLNQFNLFKGLSADARAALAVLCLPAGATFGMPGPAMAATDVLKIFVMWAMMAFAMMLPSAIPMLRAYHLKLGQETNSKINPASAVISASMGYVFVWLGYAAVATSAQVLLFKIGAVSDMMAPATLALTTSVLFAAGLYQFTPAKKACLARCWYPRWVFAETNTGNRVATGMKEGVVQGWACLGCCWAVMTVMFAVGLMNVIWIALLGAVMALEKTFPSRIFPNLLGVFFLMWAGFLTTLILVDGNAF
ncbi:hypothetical protein FIV00_16835 [Labrenzia sp. THAF82]|uniref:DUF2182 domain-containing protein n=1 Tax=Labrenzia sp. THAF82 TaxID=2587861 RepID=UPI0012A888A9|nr:DUF2182 domain-containing protein [Labrenzia sp. THAF82]QFT32159.1 hypothetical protein FIV00_16835 [Labrenzia sp. THAF82]